MQLQCGSVSMPVHKRGQRGASSRSRPVQARGRQGPGTPRLPRAGGASHIPADNSRLAGSGGTEGEPRPRYLLGAGDPRDATAHHGEAAPRRAAGPRHGPAPPRLYRPPLRLRRAGGSAATSAPPAGTSDPVCGRPEAAFPPVCYFGTVGVRSPVRLCASDVLDTHSGIEP